MTKNPDDMDETTELNSWTTRALTAVGLGGITARVCYLHERIFFKAQCFIMYIGKLAWYFKKTAGRFGNKKLGWGGGMSKTYFIWKKWSLCWLVQSLHYNVHYVRKVKCFQTWDVLKKNITFFIFWGGGETQSCKIIVFKQQSTIVEELGIEI